MLLAVHHARYIFVVLAINLYGALAQARRPTAAIVQFRNEALASHNIYRAKHGAPPLRLSAKINNWSQNWANALARRNKMWHRPDNQYGENLYMAWSSNRATVNGSAAVDAWYNEIKDYDFNAAKFTSGTGWTGCILSTLGHFTAVVWKSSTQLGVGRATASDGSVYVVANYDPPGNFLGRFRENVLPAKHRGA